MGNVPWTPEEIEYLTTGIESGKQVEDIARGLPARTPQGCWQKIRALGLHSSYGIPQSIHRVVSQTAERTVFAPEETDDEPIEELWEAAVLRTSRAVGKIKNEGLGRVQIVTDQPIAISLSSDWHISSTGAVHLPELREYAEAIRDTEGAYAVAVGDMTENPIKWDKEMPDVRRELRLLDLIVSIFGEKLLWWISGNHDNWTTTFSGIDHLRGLSKDRKLLYAPDELTVAVEIVSPETNDVTARYIFAVRHKFYRNSQINWTHPAWRWLEERVGQWPVGPDGGVLIPDVLAVAHNHVATVEARDYANKRIWAVRMGAWQAGSAHGRAGGWMTCPPTAPTFILQPYPAPVWGSPDYRDALERLATVRGGEVPGGVLKAVAAGDLPSRPAPPAPLTPCS